ncbi:DUF1758 domain-containing protein [Trichonephila clavipes]|nr:DUF1758 domain-containing protein [Trichonephila clavipes]
MKDKKGKCHVTKEGIKVILVKKLIFLADQLSATFLFLIIPGKKAYYRASSFKASPVNGFARGNVYDVPVHLSVDGALVECHDVLCEGAGLVGEDVLDLTQLLVEGGRARFCRSIVGRVVHLLVPVDEQAVKESDYLHTEGKRKKVYKNDIEFVRSLVENTLEKSKQEAEKKECEAEIQLEKIKLSQIERQLVLANVRKEFEKNPQTLESGEPSSITDKLESLVKSIKTLTIQVPVRSESLNLFFHSLEKAFQIKSVPDELKAEILLNILGERVNNLLTYVSQEDLSNYVKIKDLILREFEPTPQECLGNFKKARKLPSERAAVAQWLRYPTMAGMS